MSYDVLCYCHLRWSWVYQRPQHLLTRLAHDHRVFVFEEPLDDGSEKPWLEVKQVAENVWSCVPHMQAKYPFFVGEQIPVLVGLSRELIDQHHIERPVVWLYTPMALPVVQAAVPHPQAIVYDIMDELSAFRFAPVELLPREAEALRLADVVFTGGRSLYNAKLGRHTNLHCFPSSVDAEHYRQALKSEVAEPPDQQRLPHPRLGYFGVIDERIDLGLFDSLARNRPDWQIVMVGPTIKIEDAQIPRYPNMHWMGGRQYAELPLYVKGWDVCLLPFALNESTRFISPTKTLEYMAAEKPIVATPITDVVQAYSQVVYIAQDAHEFITCCERALSKEGWEERLQGMREILEQTSWDLTVQQMERLIDEAVRKRSLQTAPPE